MQTKIIIRPAGEEDYPAIVELLKEFAAFQKMPGAMKNSVAQLKKEKEFFHCLVAENEAGSIIGLATYFIAYYSWVGKSLYLDDLYVSPSKRGNRTGSRLLRTIFDIAVKEECKRVRWQVSDWNQPAIDFYKKCGAAIDTEPMNCDFDINAIKNFVIS